MKKQWIQRSLPVGRGLAVGLLVACALASCNVTRTVTTRSEAWQKGDTSVIIQTKTIESYDGTRK